MQTATHPEPNMTEAIAHAPDVVEPSATDMLRTCLVTGETLPKTVLIRFVVSPDNMVIPDLSQNLPGRGLWVKATYAAIAEAAKKNPFSRAAKQTVRVAPDLADTVFQLTQQRCLNMLGMAKRAGLAVIGQAQVEGAVKADKIKLLFIAPGAGRDVEKLALQHHSVEVSEAFTRQQMGSALGYDQIVYVGLTADKMTKKLVAMLGQMAALSPPPPATKMTNERNA